MQQSSTLPIPPLEMRKLVGAFEESAFENPTGAPILGLDEALFDSVLDFGCGCGRLARQMLQQRPRPNRYLGIDLHAGQIDWCTRNLTPFAPQFRFHHHDVASISFNPGNDKPQVLPIPAADQSFSLIIAWSLFTHTIQEHAEFYLKETSRLLRRDGELIATFFIFDKRCFPMMQDFQNALYINLIDPSNAVVFDGEWLQMYLRSLGLGIVKFHPPGIRGFQWKLHIRRLESGFPVQEMPEDNAPFGRKPPPLITGDASRIGQQ